MTPPGTRARRTALVWFAFAGGLTAYALHLVVVFWLLAADCPPGTDVVVVLGTVVAIAVAAAAVVVGRRLGRGADAAGDDGRLPPPHGDVSDDRSGRGLLIAVGALAALRRRERPASERPTAVADGWDTTASGEWRPWLATVGSYLSGLSLVIIALSGVAAAVLPECAG